MKTYAVVIAVKLQLHAYTESDAIDAVKDAIGEVESLGINPGELFIVDAKEIS